MRSLRHRASVRTRRTRRRADACTDLSRRHGHHRGEVVEMLGGVLGLGLAHVAPGEQPQDEQCPETPVRVSRDIATVSEGGHDTYAHASGPAGCDDQEARLPGPAGPAVPAEWIDPQDSTDQLRPSRPCGGMTAATGRSQSRSGSSPGSPSRAARGGPCGCARGPVPPPGPRRHHA